MFKWGEPQGSSKKNHRAIIGQDDNTIIAVDGGLLACRKPWAFPGSTPGGFRSLSPGRNWNMVRAKG